MSNKKYTGCILEEQTTVLINRKKNVNIQGVSSKYLRLKRINVKNAHIYTGWIVNKFKKFI